MPSAAELDALLGRAMSAHQAGRLAEAQSSYKAVLKQVPNHHPTLHFLGLSYFQQGEPDRGIEFISKALSIKPDYVEARYNLATALYRLQRYEAAAGHYTQVLAVDANNADAHNNLGAALQELKRFDEAIAHFQNALAIDPNYGQAHNNLATVFKEIGRYDEAAAHYQKALAINPDDAEVYSNLGSVLLELKRYDAAVAAFDEALNRNPGLEFVPGDRIQAKLQNCDWSNYDADRERIEDGVKNGKKVAAVAADFVDYIIADPVIIPAESPICRIAISPPIRPGKFRKYLWIGHQRGFRLTVSCFARSTTATRSDPTSSRFGCGC